MIELLCRYCSPAGILDLQTHIRPAEIGHLPLLAERAAD
jgi:hypothetical protein